MNRRLIRHRVLAGVFALLCGVLAGCGIPLQQEPTVIEPSTVPFGLADAKQRSPQLVDGPTATPAFVYFVSEDRLTGVFRSLSSGTSARQVEAVLRTLAGGPTRTEQLSGLSSAIPPGLRLQLTGLDGNLATIDLSGDTGPSAVESPLTVAQIVLTVTSLSDVERVLLTRDDESIDAPLVDGPLTSAPLTARDYRSLRLAPGYRPDGGREEERNDDEVPLEDDSAPSDPDQPDAPDGVGSGGSVIGFSLGY